MIATFLEAPTEASVNQLLFLCHLGHFGHRQQTHLSGVLMLTCNLELRSAFPLVQVANENSEPHAMILR